MKVQILSRKLIPPSSPTPTHLKSLKISSFDMLIPPLYGASILFYPASCSDNQVIDNARRSEQLQKSLSEILAIYYPLAGRCIDEKHLIDCNDKGAEYLEAHASGSISEFCERAELEAELRNLLLPYTYQPPNSPLVAIQFNVFECGGLAVGICVTHRIADGFTHFTFVNSWANACRLGIDKIHAAPNFDLGSICPPKDIPSSSTVNPISDEEKKIVRRSLLFKSSVISKLKAIANANCKDPDLLKQPAKGGEVVAALIWKTLISISAIEHGHLRPSVLVLPYDMRNKATVLPENCCGNLVCLAVSQEFVPNEDDKEVQLHDLVGYIRKTARKGNTDCEKASNAEELFMATTNAAKELNAAASKKEVDVIVFNNMNGFPMYQNDFGWGKPDLVQIAYYPTELVFLVNTKDGDGIEAWLSLEENTMLRFLKDPDIIAFTGHGSSKL